MCCDRVRHFPVFADAGVDPGVSGGVGAPA
nr:MAG TPA_asm: hypothetical protein [Caudoviricetes sp.]